MLICVQIQCIVVCMKIMDANSKSMVVLESDIETPVGAPELVEGDVVEYLYADGMYAVCMKGHERVYVKLWTEVNEL